MTRDFQPSRTTLVFAAAALVLSAALSIGLVWNPAPNVWWTNGGEIRTREAEAPLRRILWLPAQPVPGAHDEAVDEYEPRFSADGTTMVFVRRRTGHNADLFLSKWTPVGWSEATPLEAINTENDELGPELARDGKSLYFYSDRPGGLGGYDLWVSRATDAGWGTPTNLGPTVNSSWNEYGPALAPDGATLYFSSNRPRMGEAVPQGAAWTATIREQNTRHDYDLYKSDLSGPEPGAAVALTELNTPFDEGAPALSPVGDFLYFASDRPGGLGGFDVYRARVLGSIIRAAENLGSAVNSVKNDLDPALSADGFRLFFSSDRRASVGGVGEPKASSLESDESRPRYGLWQTASREVFEELEAVPRNAWLAKMWAAIWPWLGLLLLTLIPLFALWYLLKNEMWRKRLGQLSLLAQCVLLSLLIHAAIMAGLAVWKVGSGIVEAMKPAGGTQVILASSGVPGDIGGQVFGGSTDVATPVSSFDAITASVSAPTVDAAAVLAAPPPLIASVQPALEFQPAMSANPSQSMPTTSVPDARLQSVDALIPQASAPRASGEAGASMPAALSSVAATPVAGSSSDAPSADVPLPQSQHAESAVGTMDVRIPDRAIAANAGAVASSAGSVAPGGAAELASSAVLPTAITPAAGSARSEAKATAELTETRAGMAPVMVTAGVPNATRTDLAPPAMQSGAGSKSVMVPATETDRRVGAMNGSVGSSASAPGRQIAQGTGLAPLPQATAAQGASAREAQAGVVGVALGTLAAAAGAASDHQALSSGPAVVQPGAMSSAGAKASLQPLSSFGEVPVRGSAVGVGSAPSAPGRDIGSIAGDSRLPVTPSEPVKPVETFAQRAPEVRSEVLEKMGGNAETEKAVGLALEWFARHQERDGRWTGRHFDDRCGKCDAPADFDADAAMTGMALLCYLGAGHTHKSDGPYRDAVQRAIGWLVARQLPNGDLRQGETMYGQTVATVALCEALSMTKDQTLAGPARRAVQFVLQTAAKPRSARTSDEDTSVLGWLVMTVESARRAGIAVPRDVFDSAARWLDSVAATGAPGRYAYSAGRAPSAAMTAEAMFVRQLLGHARTEAPMEQSAAFILQTPPKWENGAPTYYWYYATLALFEHQGDSWKRWNEGLRPELLGHQRRDSAAAGSWDPQDEWSKLGGRIYQTAICTLSLEVYYRYKPRAE